MRGFNNARQLARVLTNRLTIADSSILGKPARLWRSYHGVMDGNHLNLLSRYQSNAVRFQPCLAVQSRYFSLEVNEHDSTPTPTPTPTPTEAVKEIYDKTMKEIVEKRSCPPKVWLQSLIKECAVEEDIKLLFEVLQRLRRFKLSNLRIPDNFKNGICLDVAKACVRAGCIDYGKKTLWKHNLYGLTPLIGSAHQLLLYAKQNKDVELMQDVMNLVRKNGLPLQSGSADIVFSICYDANNWGLLSKYARMFVKAGVKLRQTSIDIWMDFAAKTGDVNALWNVEKLRSESDRQHTVVSGIACAKGYLLEQQPENAAGVIELLTQTLPDQQTEIKSQLEKLVTEWPVEVIKHQKPENKGALAVSLQKDVPGMIVALTNIGVEVNASLEDLTNIGVEVNASLEDLTEKAGVLS